MASLQGQVAVVTGAGTGIGRAIALAMADEGAHVVLLGRREEPLARVAEEIRALGVQALDRPADVTDAAAVEAVVQEALAQLGRVDILVNAAGANATRRTLEEITVENWRAVIDVNLTGTFVCARAVLPIMRRQGQGTIINIASWAGKRPSRISGAAYSAAKTAVVALNESINMEERAHGIRSCVISPGEVDTPILDTRPYPPSAAARATMLHPEDLAAAALLVASLPQRATIEELVIRPTVLRDTSADRRIAEARETTP